MLQERKRLEDTLLSRSFLHWGGEIRPISRPVKLQLLTAVIPELDINLLANLTNYEIDQLYFVFFKVVADGKLANVGLTNKPLIAAAELLNKKSSASLSAVRHRFHDGFGCRINKYRYSGEEHGVERGPNISTT